MPTAADALLHAQSISNANLDSARGMEVIEIGGRSFLYVAAVAEDVINVFELFADATAVPVAVVVNDSTLALNGVSGFASTTVNGTTYLYAASEFDDAITVFSVGNDGALTLVENIIDDTTLELNTTYNEMSIATVGGNQFLVAQGYADDGISVFQIGNDGRLTNTDNADDTQNTLYGLNGPGDTVIVEAGNSAFLYVSGFDEDALTIFELSSTGTLTYIDTLRDSSLDQINGAAGLETVRIGGIDYVYLAAGVDDAIKIYQVNSDGTLTDIGTVLDDPSLGLNGASDLEVFAYEGTNYLAVTGNVDDAVTVFEIGNDGLLTLVDTAFESLTLPLSNTRHVAFADVDGQGVIIASAVNDDAISLFQFGADIEPIAGTENNDVLNGTQFAEEIAGFGGNDVLLGNQGDDTLSAGEGSDVALGGDGNDLLIGDGVLTQTESDVVTVAETGLDIALSVTLPDTSDSSSIEISGLINRQPLASADFNIVYVVDVSGSMASAFTGVETVGDVNGDGLTNTLLDGTIIAFNSLNESIVDAGFVNANATIVAFESNAQTVFDGTVVGDVAGGLASLRDQGGTDFEVALQQTIAELQTAGPGENRVFFISDGGNNQGGSILDEVATLTDPFGLNAQIVSIGLGSSSVLADLDLVDDGLANNSAVQVLEPSTLTANLSGSPVQETEIDRIEVYVNGVLQNTLDNTQFANTPLGLQYNVTVAGLSTTAGDVIDVVLVASDTAMTQVAVSLTVPNEPQDAGDDLLVGGNGADTLQGDAGNDSLLGEADNDALSGGAGDDFLDGGDGNDRLIGGSGNDTLIGSGGQDTLQGGIGNDRYYIDAGDVVDESTGASDDFDTIYSRLGIDLGSAALLGDFEGANLRGSANVDAIGNSADNLLRGNSGDNSLQGNGGTDTLFGGDGADTLNGGAGDDSLNGGRSGDVIIGSTGNDTINGAEGGDTIFGGDGSDQLSGFVGNDEIDAGDGADTVTGGGGNDVILGGANADQIQGGNGADTLLGEGQADRILGGSSADLIDGGTGADTLRGDDGGDTLIGGTGTDLLTGGNQADVFVFADGFGQDTIVDFDALTNAEKIDLSGVTAITDFADLSANHMTQVGSRVVIDDGAGNTIRLDGVLLADLGANDFIF